ncbi:MAG: glycoside hydrolase family 2 protein [Bacteroidetes bacterium]|nr:MAG: glycoside hydrolase family 2 protein [Bacteroidota bacterium]
MKVRLIVVFLLFISGINAQTIDVKAFKWNLLSDTVSVKNINPSDVYMALLSKRVVDNPFYRGNEDSLQWVGHHDWTFDTEFSLADSILHKENIEMVFDGLDTYASVFLNDSLVFQTDNMFRRWTTEVKPLLKRQNSLKIVFRSPYKVISEKRDEGLWPIPYDYGYVRKAAYQFGWDWGPTFVTCGIWKPAYLHAWNHVKINDFFVKQNRVTPLLGELELSLSLEASQRGKVTVQVYRDSVLLREESVILHEGVNQYLMYDNIVAPELWWPNGMGEPHLYHYKAVVRAENKTSDSIIIATGLRNIEVVQRTDSVGKSFYFKVNGVPVFAKGANYIPPDNFLPRVTDGKYQQIIADAKDANMNMIRVWGGGTYEKDLFYKLCDKNGIMVWQDFMFAGNMYPGDLAFMANIKQEAEESVIRLRNHPSIVLWCGNNEIDEAWHNWGWQKQYGYSKKDSAKLWNAYLEIFENVLPAVVEKYTSGTFYWPSSPSIGWGRQEAYKQGDVHYWGVWWGRAPFENYEKKIGRFMSEYGFQGMPEMKTIEEFTLPEDRRLESKVLNVHQKHPFGWEAIREYMERDYPVPEDLEDYDYVSQLLQSEGVGMAIEAHRRAKPYCMGTLYWQLNDCWPVVSWSSVDYYGRWKALHYTVRRAYAPAIVSFDEKGDSIEIWVVNDNLKSGKAKLSWKLMNFSGALLKEADRQIAMKANFSQIGFAIHNRLLTKYDSSSVFIHARLTDSNDSLLAETNHFFAKPKNLKLMNPDISVNLKKVTGGYLLFLKSNVLAKDVQLSTAANGFFEDNCFDLLPNEEKRVFFKTGAKLSSADVQLKTLNEILRAK